MEAPCKINLHLRVKNRRPDGFHELESVFLALSLGDTLRFEVLDGEGICRIRMAGGVPGLESIEPGRNLVYRAVELFRERSGFRRGLDIVLEKRTPLGAGFGGGSSDAAAALRALEALAAPAGLGLSRDALGETAEKLGSDVPFFLEGGAALVKGRGERLEPLPVPGGVAAVLVYPGFPSPTAEAFRLLDRVRGDFPPEAGEGLDPGRLPALLGGPPAAWPFRNDFLPVFFAAGGLEAAAAYREILDTLAREGADFSGLSGAGSGCFGIFTDGGKAETAVKKLSGEWNFARVTFPLARFDKAVLE